jgi:tetratricopeptide (TPR) repeat protein
MNLHRFADTPTIDFLPELPPATDMPDLEFAEQPNPGPITPRPVIDAPPALATRKRSRIVPVMALAAALSVLVAGLSVEGVQPAAVAAVSTATTAATGVPASAKAPEVAESGAPWHPQHQVDARRDDLGMPGIPATTDSLRITPSQASFNPLLVRAFDALHADQLAAAEADYVSVLVAEPHNTDALQGMAAVALRRGQTAQAEAMFRRAVEADPTNAVAQAGLVGVQEPEHAGDAEHHLKGLIAAQPDEHRLRFALGNVFATSERWQEAQQEYFHAHAGDPLQPDYLFNLAVSLDRLHQHPLAADYYAAALTAAARRPAQFEQSLASARLAELAE